MVSTGPFRHLKKPVPVSDEDNSPYESTDPEVREKMRDWDERFKEKFPENAVTAHLEKEAKEQRARMTEEPSAFLKLTALIGDLTRDKPPPSATTKNTHRFERNDVVGARYMPEIQIATTAPRTDKGPVRITYEEALVNADGPLVVTVPGACGPIVWDPQAKQWEERMIHGVAVGYLRYLAMTTTEEDDIPGTKTQIAYVHEYRRNHGKRPVE